MSREDERDVERYELTAPPRYRFEVERRDFMKIFAAMGSGLLVVSTVPRVEGQESGRAGQGRAVPRDVAGWLHILGFIAGSTSSGFAQSCARSIAPTRSSPMPAAILLIVFAVAGQTTVASAQRVSSV